MPIMPIPQAVGLDFHGTVKDISRAKFMIREQLEKHGTVIFPYSNDDVNAIIIQITKTNKLMGTIMPFGGKVGEISVGLIYGGFFHFNTDSFFHPTYIGEKLQCSQTHAEMVCEVLNAVYEHEAI